MNSPGPVYDGTQGGEVWGQPGPVTDNAFVWVFVVVSVFSQVCVHVKVCELLRVTVKAPSQAPPLNCDWIPNDCLKVLEVPLFTLEVFTFTVLYTIVVPPPFPGPAWK